MSQEPLPFDAVETAFHALSVAELEEASAKNRLDAVKERARDGAPVSADELTQARLGLELATMRGALVADRLRAAQEAERVAVVEAKAGALLGAMAVNREQVRRAHEQLKEALKGFAEAVDSHEACVREASSLPGGVTERVQIDRSGRRIDGVRIVPLTDVAVATLARAVSPLFRRWNYGVLADPLAAVVGPSL